MSDDDLDRAERKDRYETAVSIVAHATGDGTHLPPFVKRGTINVTAGHGRFDPTDLDSALRAAVENQQLYRIVADRSYYAVRPHPHPRAALGWANEQFPGSERVGLKQHLAGLVGDGDA